jgi:hypothetical protein
MTMLMGYTLDVTHAAEVKFVRAPGRRVSLARVGSGLIASERTLERSQVAFG